MKKTIFSFYAFSMRYKMMYIIMYIIFITGITFSQDNSQRLHNNSQQPALSLAFAKTSYTFNFINSLNVFESTLYTATYSGLVTADPQTLQPKVGLAVSWFANKDNSVYTFNLRRNAKFSDGSPITAEDVKQSWLTSIKKQNPFIYLFYPIKGVSNYINGKASLSDIKIEALSERVLRVNLERPTNYFLKIITHSTFSVTSKKQLQKDNWDDDIENIAFSGPYVVQDANESYIILKKNNNFWGKDSVKTDEIHIAFYEENQKNDVIAQFLDGSVQWTDAFSTQTIANVDKNFIYDFPLFGTEYLFFKTQTKPWDNANVRRAIRLLLPLEEILKKHYSFIATNLIRKIPAYTPPLKEIEPQDVNVAKKLLREAGFPNGNKLPPITIFIPKYSDETYHPIFDDIKEALTKYIKVKIILKQVPANVYYSSLATQDYTIATNSWIGDFADPMAFLQMWAYKNELLGSDYDNSDYRLLLENSYIANSLGERERFLQAAEKKLLYDGIVIPMRALHAVEFVRSDIIEGWAPNPLNIHNLAAITFIAKDDIPYLTYNSDYTYNSKVFNGNLLYNGIKK